MDNDDGAAGAAAKPIAAPADTISNSPFDHYLREGLEPDPPGRVEPVGCLNQAEGTAGNEFAKLEPSLTPRCVKALGHSADKGKVVRDELLANWILHGASLFRRANDRPSHPNRKCSAWKNGRSVEEKSRGYGLAPSHRDVS